MTPKDYVAYFAKGPFDGKSIYMHDFKTWPPVWTFYRFANNGVDDGSKGYLEIRYLHIRDGRYEYDSTSDDYIEFKEENDNFE